MEGALVVKCALYARVSSKAQAERHTVQSQLRTLRTFAAERGWTVLGEYVDDGRSAKAGKLAARDGFGRLIADAQAGRFDVVAVFDLDRLTRSEDITERGQILGAFQRAGVRLAIATSGQVLDLASSMGDLFSGLQAFFAAEENRKRSERTKAGKARAIAEGRKPGGVTPFGLRFDLQSGWSVDDAEAALVREMFRRVADGESCREIDFDLDSRGVRRPRGGSWGTGRTWRIVTSSAYRGEWVVSVEAGLVVAVPPIVDVDLWHAAQVSLAELGKRWLRRSKHVYLLEDIAVCALCGGRIAVCSHGHDAGRPRRPTTYVCARRRRPIDGLPNCTMAHVRQSEMDAAVWEALVAFVSRPDLAERALRDRSGQAGADGRAWQDDAQSMKARLARLQRTEEAILARFRTGIISDGAMDTELSSIARMRIMITKQLASAERGAAVAGRAADQANQLAASVTQIRDRIHRTTPVERQTLVRALLGTSPVILGAKELRVTISLTPGVGQLARAGWRDRQETNVETGLQFPLVVRTS